MQYFSKSTIFLVFICLEVYPRCIRFEKCQAFSPELTKKRPSLMKGQNLQKRELVTVANYFIINN